MLCSGTICAVCPRLHAMNCRVGMIYINGFPSELLWNNVVSCTNTVNTFVGFGLLNTAKQSGTYIYPLLCVF